MPTLPRYAVFGGHSNVGMSGLAQEFRFDASNMIGPGVLTFLACLICGVSDLLWDNSLHSISTASFSVNLARLVLALVSAIKGSLTWQGSDNRYPKRHMNHGFSCACMKWRAITQLTKELQGLVLSKCNAPKLVTTRVKLFKKQLVPGSFLTSPRYKGVANSILDWRGFFFPRYILSASRTPSSGGISP